MPATPPPCPGNPKGGHWWICEDSTGRFSKAYCKLCPATREGETAFSNTYDESTAEYGYLDGNQGRGKKRMKREPGTSLTADERSKRHIFYEAHQTEIIETYEKLKKNAKATAQELSKKWKVEIPSTTLHGLLRRWKVEKPEPPAPESKRIKKTKRKKLKKTSNRVKTTPVVTEKGVKGELVGLERLPDGGVKATLHFLAGADLRLGSVRLEVS